LRDARDFGLQPLAQRNPEWPGACHCFASGTNHAESGRQTMKDLIFIGITVAFFASAWLYTRACERL
jgi:hypothetical protein